jgi:HPr kinase/phosphorylase
MAQEFTVSLQAIIDECKLEVIHTPQDPAKIFISNIDVNRPGLQLAGFTNISTRAEFR